jgi:hypothetical protein
MLQGHVLQRLAMAWFGVARVAHQRMYMCGHGGLQVALCALVGAAQG